MQHALLIALFVLYALGITGTLIGIDKPRKPLSSRQAAFTVGLQVAVVAMLISLW